MYYSENVRKKKVKELENNKEFIEYAQNKYEEIKRCDAIGGDQTFEQYLLHDVFELYDNFTMIQFLQKSDKKTIDRVLNAAIKGLDI